MTTSSTHTKPTVHYKRLTPVQTPEYKTPGSVAFDIAAARTVHLTGHGFALIPTGLVIATPEHYALLIFARSSLYKRTQCVLTNSVGVIDQDYCGDDDEIMVSLWNTRPFSVWITKGDRIAQGMFVRMAEAAFEEVSTMNSESRGGFGSTG